MTIHERRSAARLAQDHWVNRRFWWTESVVMAVIAVALLLSLLS